MKGMSNLSDRIQKANEQTESMHQFDKFGLRRTFHGYYYISHYYPLRAQAPIDPVTAAKTIASLEGSKFETYIHFPYCEQLCSFCHFYKKTGVTSEKENEIMDAVEKEIEMYSSLLGGKIMANSLQFGGGTPSLMSNMRLAKLLENVQKHMSFAPNAEIKMEIYPKRYEATEIKEKLRILKDFGFTDLVIDLESGNKQTLDFIARTNSSLEAYLELIDICVGMGFNSIVSALMPGLPYETFESLEHTLQTLMSISEIKVINTFPVIMRETDPITRQYHNKPEVFNDNDTREAMWLFARNTLRERGYVEGPISYLHHPSKRPDQQADKFECVNLLGFGVSSFGYLNGQDWAGQYFNYCNKTDYLEKINSGELAMWRLGKYDQAERTRRKVIFGLANVKTENLFAIEDFFGTSIDDIYGKQLNAFLELKLIAIDQEKQGIYYTEEGLCRLEELSYFLSSKYVKDVCDKLPNHNDKHYKELINQHYFVTIPREDRQRFEKFIEQQSSAFMCHLKRNQDKIETLKLSQSLAEEFFLET